MNKIPKQLQNTEFRFFLAGKNSKIPIEKWWNSKNNYLFFEDKVKEHLKAKKNLGIVTGIGNLIVIDFDSKDYQHLKAKMLPKTFTVKTACKGLNHMYYLLDTDKMIKKIGIGIKTRLADIQASRCGAVCPPSSINGKYYVVVEDCNIAHISLEKLKEVFNIKSFKTSLKRGFNTALPQPKKVQDVLDLFNKIGIERTAQQSFKCPFHHSNSKKSLYLFPEGTLYCFHCEQYWSSAKDFKAKWQELNKGVVII